MSIWEMNIWQLIRLGGPLMVPIILCSWFALGIVIGKFLYFAGIKTDTGKLKKDLYEFLRANKIREAVTLCDGNPAPVAKILKAGILKFGSSREEIKEAMEEVSRFEIPKLESRMTALATIANVTPLLGLLGTVTGMTESFYTLQAKAAGMTPITPGDLAGGIWEALLTTVAGLMVAIPCFVAYNYLVSRIHGIILEMERTAADLVNFLCHITESSTAVSPENDLNEI